MIVYIESSAAAKLLLDEPETADLEAYLEDEIMPADELISSFMLETELRRTAVRMGVDQVSVTELLEMFDLVEIERSVYAHAGLLPGDNLRTLDALHVAAALRFGADTLIAYDNRQTAAARAAGLAVVSPGRQ